jgi:putative GTP pyrophosphokinase
LTSSNDVIDKGVKWFEENRPIYIQFTEYLHALMKNLLSDRKINAYDVTSRTKDLYSFKSKLEKTRIKANNMQDLTGLRIIAYELSDIDKICNCIKDNFAINRTKLFPEDKPGSGSTGYRSTHLVCSLGENRTRLPEYNKFSGLVFEIRVRTILQHAWAEIGHERNYKFTAGLPPDLQKRFDSLALDLKVIDEKFKRISWEIDHYTNYNQQKMNQGNLKIRIDPLSLRQYMLDRIKKAPSNLIKVHFGTANYSMIIIEELRLIGKKTLEDLDKLVTDEFIDKFLKALSNLNQENNYLGFIRNLMIVKFIDRYSKLPRKRSFNLDPSEVELLNQLGISKDTLKRFGWFK